MPRVGLNTVKETSNDVADTCSNRSDPGNIVFQGGALLSLYHSAPQDCLFYVWNMLSTLPLSESPNLCSSYILRLHHSSHCEM